MAKNNSAMPLLGLILAVPAVACYVWWTHLNAETKQQLSLRVRSRTDGVSFGATLNRNKLSNPITSSPAAASSAVPAISSGVAAPESNPPAVLPVSVKAATATVRVVITRDPTISPFDVVRMQQIQYEKEQAELELKKASEAKSTKHKEPPIETRIELQGIVSSQRGNRAIVNGDTVGAGDVVLGARILKITAQTVVFSYKNRRFKKTISK